MELILTRIAKRSDYTIGRLTKGIGGDYICDTLEPPVVETKTRKTMEQVFWTARVKQIIVDTKARGEAVWINVR